MIGGPCPTSSRQGYSFYVEGVFDLAAALALPRPSLACPRAVHSSPCYGPVYGSPCHGLRCSLGTFAPTTAFLSVVRLVALQFTGLFIGLPLRSPLLSLHWTGPWLSLSWSFAGFLAARSLWHPLPWAHLCLCQAWVSVLALHLRTPWRPPALPWKVSFRSSVGTCQYEPVKVAT